jgi:hypothetical protein
MIVGARFMGGISNDNNSETIGAIAEGYIIGGGLRLIGCTPVSIPK